jgi:(2Fe-2S) ferredoxin
VKAHLVERASAVRPAKVLFIRRRERRSSEGLHVFWGRSTEHDSWLSATVIDAYSELLELELADPGDATGHPLFLVCTHGKHDACCAKYGLPLYEAIRELVDEGWVWQCSHVGGDRFAGNLVCLPEGVYYGRVGAGDVLALLDEHLVGRAHLDFYRGRSCHSFPLQAAEGVVREASGMLDLDGLKLVSTSPIRFRAGETEYEVEVAREQGELAQLTCGASGLSRPWRYGARILRESAA